ncbi:M48 family metallopeptidase [Alteriqipengyuania sp. 357]
MRAPSRLAAILALAITSPAFAEPAPPPPPWAGVYQPQGVDEIGLWGEDDESERKLAASPQIIRDEKLVAYLHDVLCRAVGTDRCGATRIYVIREPAFNATMSPNGTMRVYSGLLLRMRSEAELASVLGHEFGHFEQRHGLDAFKRRRSSGDVLAWASLLASTFATGPAYTASNSVTYQIYGNLFRYNRDQEREADLLGLSYLNESEFRPQAASQVWESLMGEIEASSVARGLRKPKFDAIAFTASHPPHAERAGYLADLANPEGALRDDGAEPYRDAMAQWMPVFLEDQIKLNDFGGSEYIIESLAQAGWTADLWFARGELFRARGAPRDLANAADFYREAIALQADHPGAHRGLGLSLLKLGKTTEGHAAIATYLDLEPQAHDAALIRLMLPKERAQ